MKFTIAYTLLLLYVISAIIFWGYSLNKQSNILYNLEKEKILLQKSQNGAVDLNTELESIRERKIRRTKQYLGEGSTFLLIILLSASIVYYAYYRQRKLSKLQQNFMLSVTHELKTPIAGIKLNLQTLEKRQLDDPTRKKLLLSSVHETNRLNDLCNNILFATQLESTEKALYTESISLTRLLEDTVSEIRSRYPDLNLSLQLNTPDHTIEGDTTLWKLVLSNLVENARKYSPKGSLIEVVFDKHNHRHSIAVKDPGAGIPDDERNRIFEKFYRIGNENTRTSKGTGLGLYIVKKIVKLYKYDITVKNNQPQGSIFEILI